MIDCKSLETFLWVANLRSFRGAAEKLNTTQPAVSLRIAQLAEDLGVRLLGRARARTPARLLGPISNPGIHNRPLCSFPLSFVAGERIRFAKKTVSLAELA